MVRQFVLALSAVVGLSGFSIPAIATDGYQACLNQAAAQRQANIARGTDRATANRIWAQAVNDCKTQHKRASLIDAIALSVPRDSRPGRKLPNPGGQVARIVDRPEQCGDDVALPTNDGRVECVPAPKTESKLSFDSVNQNRYCDRIVKTQCRKGMIIRSLPPLHEVAVDEPTTNRQDPAQIFPGLHPAPTAPKLASVCNPLKTEICPKPEPVSLISFAPPKENPYPLKGAIGGSGRAIGDDFNPEPNKPPVGTGGTGTR